MTGQGISGGHIFSGGVSTRRKNCERTGISGQYQEIEISEEEAKSARTACGWYLHSGLTARNCQKAMEEFLAGYETPMVSEKLPL